MRAIAAPEMYEAIYKRVTLGRGGVGMTSEKNSYPQIQPFPRRLALSIERESKDITPDQLRTFVSRPFLVGGAAS